MRFPVKASLATFVLGLTLALFVAPAAAEPLFEEWTTSTVYEHSSTAHKIHIVHREFTGSESAQERFANIDRLMPSLLGENAHQEDLPEDVRRICALFAGEFAGFGEEPRPAWAVECLSESDTYLMIVDEGAEMAIALAESLVENGEPAIPAGYELVTSPGDYPGSNTIRGVRLEEDRPEFQEVDLELTDENGNFLEIRVEETSDWFSYHALEHYDPGDVNLGHGEAFISENQDPVRICRQFTYRKSDGNLYSAVCSHGAWNLHVVGTDEEAVEFAAAAFSEDGTENYVPEGYVHRE